MSVIGAPSDWVDFIDSLVPDILDLIWNTWPLMESPISDIREDPITYAFARLLKQSRSIRDLPFQIHVQMVELQASEDEERGRLDVAFVPGNQEAVYFCLECKRLSVPDGVKVRSYSSEYVTHGMMRFVRGQYSKPARHGGMLGYVLNGNVPSAIAGVSEAIKARAKDLGMALPGQLQPSKIRPKLSGILETTHRRKGIAEEFQIHHLFVPCSAAVTRHPTKSSQTKRRKKTRSNV